MHIERVFKEKIDDYVLCERVSGMAENVNFFGRPLSLNHHLNSIGFDKGTRIEFCNESHKNLNCALQSGQDSVQVV